MNIGLSETEEGHILSINELSSNKLAPMEMEAFEFMKKGNTEEAMNLLFSQEYLGGVEEVGRTMRSF